MNRKYTDRYSHMSLFSEKIKILLLIIFTFYNFNLFAQTSSLISDCSDFVTGPNAWPYVLVATTIDDGVMSQAAQTYTMNITSLPANGANVRVYKTTANGNDYFGNPVELTLGSNSITVSAVSFDRAVKFQFSSGDVEFEALSLNGNDTECVVPLPPGPSSLISDCSDFVTGPNAWPYILIATTIADGIVSQEAQTYTMNITSLPAEGANVRVYKTVANGNDFFGNPVELTLGSNSITVDAVSFDRAVKFQFSSGDVEFDALSLNGENTDCVCSPISFETDLIIKCDSYTWVDGLTYTSSNNTANYTYINSVGCDSIVHLNLIINQSDSVTDTQIAVDSYTWIDGLTYTTSNNTATFNLTNSNNCDSIITLDLTINSSSDIDFIEANDILKYFPNPTSDELTIELEDIDFADIYLIDILGKVLYHKSGLFNQYQINLSNYESGTYFLQVTTPRFNKKIIISKQ